MKLLPESPVEFIESSFPWTEPVFAARITGTFGSVSLAGTERGLLSALLDIPFPHFLESVHDTWGVHPVPDDAPFAAVADQFRAYLEGEPVVIHTRVHAARLSPFTRNVHEIIARIPWGETVTYGELALFAGHPGAARAAGAACGRNRVLVAVPCHRVVAANGLGGFSGNLELKRRLLEHEK
jgi:methylated-DNA-[protein]-cysteine S-methyltransferase